MSSLKLKPQQPFLFHRTTVYIPEGDVRANQRTVEESYTEK